MSDKKLAEYVVRFGKWSGLPLSQIPIDAIWWMLEADRKKSYLYDESRSVLRQYLNHLWRNPQEGWLTFGKYQGIAFDDCPTWWLQGQLSWIEFREARHGCWPSPKEQGNWSPVVKHLLRKELLQRETELGVMERRDDGSWYEKLPREDRENDFSPDSEFTAENEGGTRRWPSLWYTVKARDIVSDDLVSDGHPQEWGYRTDVCEAWSFSWEDKEIFKLKHVEPWGRGGIMREWELPLYVERNGYCLKRVLIPAAEGCGKSRPQEERKEWSVVMSKPNCYTKLALEKALSYRGCGCTKRCSKECSCGCHRAWERWRKLKDRKDEISTWLDTLRALEINCNKEQSLMDQYCEGLKWINNVNVEGGWAEESLWLSILQDNLWEAQKKAMAKEMLACERWHEAVAQEEENDADGDEASPKLLSERRQRERTKEIETDEAREFLSDLRRQKKARLKKLKYQRRYAQRTEHAQEVLEEARNSIGGAWACRVCIGDTEGVRLCE